MTEPEFRSPEQPQSPLHERVEETQDLVGNPEEQNESADVEPSADNESQSEPEQKWGQSGS